MDIETDQGYESEDIEEEENEDQEEFLYNPTRKNFQDWHLKKLGKEVLSINNNKT